MHTAQHYDAKMSQIFFDQFNLTLPEYQFEIDINKSYASQLSSMCNNTASVFEDEKPEAVIVYGDTTTTIAALLAAVKKSVPILHIEAGMRSNNTAMSEETNRVVCDQLSKLFFSPPKQPLTILLQKILICRVCFL